MLLHITTIWFPIIVTIITFGVSIFFMINDNTKSLFALISHLISLGISSFVSMVAWMIYGIFL